MDYAQFHADMYQRFLRSNELLGNWEASGFEGVVCGKEFVPFDEKNELDFGKIEALESADSVAASDKTILQNYGRPYENGKPSGTYYKFAKKEYEK